MLKMIKTTSLTTLAALTLAAGISTQANAATPQITGPSIAQTAEFTQNNDLFVDSIIETPIFGSVDNFDDDLADVTLVANRRGFRSRRGSRSRGFSSRRGSRSRGFSSRRGFGHSKFKKKGFHGHSKFHRGGFYGHSKFGHRGFNKKSFGRRHF